MSVLVKFPHLEYELLLGLASNERIWKVMRSHFLRVDYKYCNVCLAHFLSAFLPCSLEVEKLYAVRCVMERSCSSELVCPVNNQWGPQGCQQPSHMCSEMLQQLQSWWHSLKVCERPLNNIPATLHLDSWLTETDVIKLCCFMSLAPGLIYYAAIDNNRASHILVSNVIHSFHKYLNPHCPFIQHLLRAYKV